MKTTKKPLLWAIDQTLGASLSIGLTGDREHKGWRTVAIDNLDAVDLRAEAPKLILLHGGDQSKWSTSAMLDKLQKRNLANRTVLVSGSVGDDNLEPLKDIQARYRLKAVMPRPIDFVQLENWLYPPKAAQPTEESPIGEPAESNGTGLADYANQLTPAVLIFQYSESDDDKVEKVVWANQAAGAVVGQPLSSADRRRINYLRAALGSSRGNNSVTSRAKFLDWDTATQQWIECHLHQLNPQTFWYTKDLRGKQAVEEDFALFERTPYFFARFDSVCNYLAQRWGMTRVRLYQVDRLPNGLGCFVEPTNAADQDGLPALKMLTPLTPGGQPIDWVVIPRISSGGGWVGTAHYADGAFNWWNHVFRWGDFIQAGITGAERDRLAPDGSANQAVFESLGVAGGSCTTRGVQTVDWGNAQHRLMDVFPGLVPNERQGSDADTPPVLISGLLALDRRTDHLTGDLSQALTKEEMARIRLAAESGLLSAPLDADETAAFTGGPLPELRKRLGAWLIDDHERRVRKWHDIVSHSIQESFSDFPGSGGMPALSALCAQLIDKWPELWKHEIARLGVDVGDTKTSILNLFFMTERNADRMDMPAGAGDLWAMYQDEANGLPKSELVKRLLAENEHSWPFLVVQDYSEWLATHDASAHDADWQRYTAELEKVKTWVAIKLPSHPGFARGMMAVHMGGMKDAAWSTVLRLLVATAKRLYPPFMLALNARHERVSWSAAVVHELKTDALVLRKLLQNTQADQAPTAAQWRRMVDLSHGLVNLSQDYLSTLDERYAPSDPDDAKAEDVDIEEQLNNALGPWRDRYPGIELQRVKLSGGKEHCKLKAHKLWRRVVRVLLHNAFRHGLQKVQITTSLQGGFVQLRVTNGATKEAVEQLPAARAGTAAQPSGAYTRSRVGLRTARLLCAEVGAMLPPPAIANGSGGLKEVTHVLDWPLDQSLVAHKQGTP